SMDCIRATARTRNRAAVIVAMLVVMSVVAAAYWPVLSAQALSLDDNDVVVYNPLVRNPSWSSAQRFFTEVFNPSTIKGYYQPLSMISLMIDYGLGGRPENLRAFHLTNLALHVMNAAALLLLMYRLFNKIVPAAAAALLFALHPLAVEPVAW